MAEEIKVIGSVSVETAAAAKNVLALKDNVENLKKEFKDSAKGSDEQAAAFVKLNKAQGDLKKATDDMNTSTKAGAGHFGNLKKSLSDFAPATDGATKGVGVFNNALNLLRANPIIAVVTLLVGAVVALFQPFKKMEAVSDALGKAFGVLSGIFNQFINGILTPLIDGFVAITELVSGGLLSVLSALGIGTKETSDRMGELVDGLDDLEDAERDSAIATAESNRKLQEAREIAADANVPIRERIAALKEAGKIEKEELDKVVQINQTKARLTMESIALEMGARADLIKAIRSGSIDQLKAARAELMSMKNVDKEKLGSIDAMIIAAEAAAAQSSKIQKKVAAGITSLEKEEADKRKEIAKEAEAHAKELAAQKKARQDKAEADAKKAYDAEVKRLQDLADAYVAAIKKRQKEEAELLDYGAQLRKEDADAAKEVFNDEQTRLQNLKKLNELDLLNNPNSGQAKIDKIKNDLAIELSTLAEGDLQRQVLAKKASNDIVAVKQEQADEEKKIASALAQHKKDMQDAELGLASGAVGFLKEIAGKSKALQKAAIIGENAIGIAKMIISNKAANIGALGTPQAILTSGASAIPVIAMNNITTALGVAASVAATAKALSAVGGGSVGGSPSVGGGNIAAPIQPQPIQTSTTLDQNSINGIGNAAQGGTNRAYIVDADYTSANERNERLSRAARLG